MSYRNPLSIVNHKTLLTVEKYALDVAIAAVLTLNSTPIAFFPEH